MPTVARIPAEPDAGFSLLELMLTIGIIGVISAMAVVQFATGQQSIKGDRAMRV